MTYRSDRDADRARIDALEAELESVREQRDELRGQRSQALVVASKGALVHAGARPPRNVWGAPLRLALEHEFNAPLPAGQLEELIETIRRITQTPGRFELLRSSLQWFGGPYPNGPAGCTVTVTIKDGRTTLAVTESLTPAASVVHAVGLSLASTAFFPVLMSFALPIGLVICGLWGGTAFLGSRAMVRRVARRHAEALHRLYEGLREDISVRLGQSSRP